MIEHIRRGAQGVGAYTPVTTRRMATSLRVLPGFKGGTTWWPEGLTRSAATRWVRCLHRMPCSFHPRREKDLQAPDMKFVIGVMGVGGPWKSTPVRIVPIHGSFREAMAAAASMPEFKGNVMAVRTAPLGHYALEGT